MSEKKKDELFLEPIGDLEVIKKKRRHLSEFTDMRRAIDRQSKQKEKARINEREGLFNVYNVDLIMEIRQVNADDDGTGTVVEKKIAFSKAEAEKIKKDWESIGSVIKEAGREELRKASVEKVPACEVDKIDVVLRDGVRFEAQEQGNIVLYDGKKESIKDHPYYHHFSGGTYAAGYHIYAYENGKISGKQLMEVYYTPSVDQEQLKHILTASPTLSDYDLKNGK